MDDQNAVIRTHQFKNLQVVRFFHLIYHDPHYFLQDVGDFCADTDGDQSFILKSFH